MLTSRSHDDGIGGADPHDRLGSPRVRPTASQRSTANSRSRAHKGAARRSRRRSHARRSSRRARTPGSEAIHPLPRWWAAAVVSVGLLFVDVAGHLAHGAPRTTVWALSVSVTASWFAAALWIWGWRTRRMGLIVYGTAVGNLLADLQVAYPDSRLAWTLGLLGLNVIGAGFFVWWWLAVPDREARGQPDAGRRGPQLGLGRDDDPGPALLRQPAVVLLRRAHCFVARQLELVVDAGGDRRRRACLEVHAGSPLHSSEPGSPTHDRTAVHCRPDPVNQLLVVLLFDPRQLRELLLEHP